ncbi:RDD family protein [Hyphomonas johnsonii]|uniref:RDD family protein n=1 Tax=Hyphomonas johnsonii MHS-2 TaxID=1280950 RepID=A0A059FV17_9PROT|nr:RDD family protein [Hyphomonas johnsonii]KCZ94447.1 RDD family protein [Hyphomonas johnsonii MHS-2]
MTDTSSPARPGISMEAAQRRRARMAEKMRIGKLVRTLVTPEGAEIHLKLATVAERAGALLIDMAIQWAIVIATLLGLSYMMAAMGFDNANVAFAFWMVFYFFVRNFYYIFFEIGQKAATPGKRALGLRVAARDGGRLTADSVLARNFMREVEIGLPLQFLLMGGDQLGAWMALLGLVWSGVFLFFPVFNRDKMRVGDLLAGTWVIKAPKATLMTDITAVVTAQAQASRYAFTPEQADAYGIHELHVLEDVLRQSSPEIKQQVAERIRGKIGWQAAAGETDLGFLEAYYAALRRRLEQRMLLGERKADKYDTRAKP